jgi:hypothetical protein
MGGLRELLATGSWLTRERLRLWALAILAASAVGLLYLAATSNGVTDYQGRPLGTDFSAFYAAGTLVREGRPDLAFDPASVHARQQAIFGAAAPYYGWLYPPFFLLVAGALASLPYALALTLWLAATLALYLAAMRGIAGLSPVIPGRAEGASPESILPDRVYGFRARPFGPSRNDDGDSIWLLLALAFPAVFVNIGHGQNGFLTAALMGGALLLLERRAVVAGVLLGLLVFKPQLGLMIPLALVAAGRWRSMFAAAVTVALLALLTLAAFGPEVWRAFLASTEVARTELLEAGVAGWHKMHSVFAVTRMWGGSTALAYTLQAMAALTTAAALYWLWRSDARHALKAAGLAVATLLVAPHSHDYDLMLLAPAIAFLLVDGFACGFARYEKTVLALVGLTPLVTRFVAEHTRIPLGAIAMIALTILVLHRAEIFRALAGAKQKRTAH